MSNFLQQIVIVVYHNSIIGYDRGSPFFVIYYDRKKAFKELEGIKILKTFQYFSEYTIVFAISSNILLIRSLNETNEVRANVEIDKESLGYKSLFQVTFGRKVPDDLATQLRYIVENASTIYDIDISGFEDVFELAKSALNHKNTVCYSEIVNQ